MKRIAILGSTGSIGRQAIEVAVSNPEEFQITALAARRDVRKLAEQVKAVSPSLIGLTDASRVQRLLDKLDDPSAEVISGASAVEILASHDDVDLVLNSMVGAAGLRSSVAALSTGKTLALANKESLVAGGDLVTSLVTREHQLLPVDSEHSAIFQCLQGEDPASISRLIVTGSGGPFRGLGGADLSAITPAQALNHPTWTMGPKITIDSATLMNKGLEVIEAHYLFGIPYEKIEVLIHPQSIVHSLVEFNDGSVKAQMGYPDMKLPIQYAMTYPERRNLESKRLNLADVGRLDFFEPDLETFACLRYALEAAAHGKTYTVALNAANEVAVAAFLEGRISFVAIAEVISQVLEGHIPVDAVDIDAIMNADRRARSDAEKWVERRGY